LEIQTHVATFLYLRRLPLSTFLSLSPHVDTFLYLQASALEQQQETLAEERRALQRARAGVEEHAQQQEAQRSAREREQQAVVEALKSAAAQREQERQEAAETAAAREREFRRGAGQLVERALEEMLAVRREVEDAAQAVAHQEVLRASREAQVAEEARKGAEEREARAKAAEAEAEEQAASSSEALRGELEEERARCRALEEEVKQQREKLSHRQGAAPRSPASGTTGFGSGDGGAGDALPSVEEEEETGGDVAAAASATLGSRGALPSVAAVWARLNPGSAVRGSSKLDAFASPSAEARDAPGQGGPSAPALFPGPSSADIVIKPKGASSWQVVSDRDIDSDSDSDSDSERGVVVAGGAAAAGERRSRPAAREASRRAHSAGGGPVVFASLVCARLRVSNRK